jgi:hypothetical protein
VEIDHKPLADITKEALELLYNNLGAVDTMRFLNQFTLGSGNYVEERKQIFDGMTIDDFFAERGKILDVNN